MRVVAKGLLLLPRLRPTTGPTRGGTIPGAVQIPIPIGHGPVHAHPVQAGVDAHSHPLTYASAGGVGDVGGGVGVEHSLQYRIFVLRLVAALHVAVLHLIVLVVIILLLQSLPRCADRAHMLIISLLKRSPR